MAATLHLRPGFTFRPRCYPVASPSQRTWCCVGQNLNSDSSDEPKGSPLVTAELRASLKLTAEKLLPNARIVREQGDSVMQHSVGVDFGDSRTGIAISFRGFAPSPLSVTQLRGDKLLAHLLDVASKQRADEFIVGLPRSWDGKETIQSNKTRSFAGRLAQHAVNRGCRVYLYEEYGTSQDAMEYMIDYGSKKSSRKNFLDAYAAMMLLRNYFDNGGAQAQLVLPKKVDEQVRLFEEYNALKLSRAKDEE